MFHQFDLQSCSLEDILHHRAELPPISNVLNLFDEYLNKGYYPFAREADFEIKLQQVISQTLEVDIPTYAQMNVSTGRKLKQLLAIVAQIGRAHV